MKAAANLAPVDLAAAVQAGGLHKHFKLRLILGLVVLILVVAAWIWWRHLVKEENQVPPYATEVLKRGDISLTITATGNLFPTNEVTVGSELSGTTLEVYVNFNDRVTKGQPLVKLDTSKLAQQTESSRAAVKSEDLELCLKSLPAYCEGR